RRGSWAAPFELARVLGAFIARQRTDHHINSPAIQLSLKIRMPVSSDFREKFFDDLESKFGVRHLTAAELERDLHFHVLAKKIDGMPNFYTEIMRINFRAQLNFFDFGGMLMLLGFFITFGLLVAVLAIIHQSANRRSGVGSNLNQIHAIGPSHCECVTQGQHPQLFAINPDYPDFARTDLAIYPDKRTGRRR